MHLPGLLSHRLPGRDQDEVDPTYDPSFEPEQDGKEHHTHTDCEAHLREDVLELPAKVQDNRQRNQHAPANPDPEAPEADLLGQAELAVDRRNALESFRLL